MALTPTELEQIVTYLQSQNFIGGPLVYEEDDLISVHVPTVESVGLHLDEIDEALDADNRSEGRTYQVLRAKGIPHTQSIEIIRLLQRH